MAVVFKVPYQYAVDIRMAVLTRIEYINGQLMLGDSTYWQQALDDAEACYEAVMADDAMQIEADITLETRIADAIEHLEKI